MASSTIKGLTVEIGGDTTKLGKALKDVEAKSRNLSKELGDINKLLKMDPGNADLLAQKQDVLAKAVENTKEKLDTLKEAEKQVQQQFEKGEVSEEQVRALQREIVATENKMKGYEKAVRETADEISKLGKKSKSADDDIEDTGKSADHTADDLDDMADKADEASDKLDDTAKSAEKAEKASDGLGKAAVAAGTFLGNLASQALSSVVDGLSNAVEESREYRTEMGKLNTAFTSAGHSTETATQTYQALQGVLGETEQAVEAANHLAKLTKNEKDLQKWTDICTGVYATFGASLPIEGLTEAANETAKTGALTGALADALNWAGVSEDDFQAKLDACTSEQQRQALIMETLNGLYSDAAATYKETNAEIIRMNEANEAWSSAMAGVGEGIEPLLTDVKLLGASLLSDLVPGIQEVATAFRGILGGNDEAAGDLGTALSGMISQLLDKLVSSLPTITWTLMDMVVALTSSLLDMAPTVARTLMKIAEQALFVVGDYLPLLISQLIDSALGVLLNLMAYVPDVIEGFSYLLYNVAAALPDLIENALSWLPELLWAALDMILLSAPELLGAVLELASAVTTQLATQLPTLIGEISNFLYEAIPFWVEEVIAAAPMIVEGLIAMVDQIVLNLPYILALLSNELGFIVDQLGQALVTLLPVLLDSAVQLFSALVEALPVVTDALISTLPTLISSVVGFLSTAVPELLNGALLLFNAILDAVPLLIEQLLPQLPLIVTSICDGLLSSFPVLLDACVTLLMALIEAIPQIIALLVKELPLILKTILQVLGELPRLIGGVLTSVLDRLDQWTSGMTKKATDAGRKFIDAVVKFFKELPDKAATWLTKTIDEVTKFGTKAISKIKSVGSDLVRGLWQGINDMVGWVTDKIKGFSSNILDGIKNFFGVHSPSRVFRDEVGKMLGLGLAEGIEDSADAPMDAMAKLSNGILGEAGGLNGLTLDRRIQHTFAQPDQGAAAETGMLSKLDKILEAIKQGQVIALDGDKLVGGTVGRTDAALGQRRVLVQRGAL